MTKAQQNLLQKSIDNIHFQQIKKRVNLESNFEWARKNPILPRKNMVEYLIGLGENFKSYGRILSK